MKQIFHLSVNCCAYAVSEQQWEPAIERLLHNFGCQMLVEEKYYQQVNRYVDSTNLHGRLVYHRISAARTPRSSERLEPDSSLP